MRLDFMLAAALVSAAFLPVAAVDPFAATLSLPPSPQGCVPMQNLVAKLAAGERILVAVAGDSIGYGQKAAAASVQGTEYATRATFNVSDGVAPRGNPMSYGRAVTDWIKSYAKREYALPDAKVDTLYCVWGGATGMSMRGYFTDEVARYAPDLLVLEIWNAHADTVPHVESMLRELWTVNPYADVVFLGVGGQFAGWNASTPLLAAYGIPFSDGWKWEQAWFEQFGTFHSDKGYLLPSGRLAGTRWLYFGQSFPHVNDEGYLYWNCIFQRDLETLFEAARGKGPAPRTLVPSVSAADSLYQGSEIVAPSALLAAGAADASSWTVSCSASTAEEPHDTVDRANANNLVAKAVGAEIALTVRASAFRLGGTFANASRPQNMQYSSDGGATWTDATANLAVLGDSDADRSLILRAKAANACFNEIYLYRRSPRPVEAPPLKHRWSVSCHARLRSAAVHDWTLGGVEVLPRHLEWLNVYRMETYGAPLRAPDASVIHADCAANGAFVGWVEADSVAWIDGEKVPSVASLAGKTVYRPGDAIDVAALGRDIDLVAVYSDGLVPAQPKTVKCVFVDANALNGTTLHTLECAPGGSVRMPPAARRHLHAFLGWKTVGGTDVYQPDDEYSPSESTEFEAVFALDDADTGTARRHEGLRVSFAERNASVSDSVAAFLNGVFDGTYTSLADGGVRFQSSSYAMEVRHGIGERNRPCISAKMVSNSGIWRYPVVRGECVVPVSLSAVKRVSVRYLYAPAGAASLAGQRMALALFARTSDGLEPRRFTVYSDESIAAGEWTTAVFDVASVLAAAPAQAAEIGAACIERTVLFFWEPNATDRPAKGLTINVGDELKVGDFAFADGTGNPFAVMLR